MNRNKDTRDFVARGRAIPAVAIGLTAILGLQAGVAAQTPGRVHRNTAIMTIAAAPAPISILDTDSLLIWTAATLAMMLLISRQARTSTALIPILPRARTILSRRSGHRQLKTGITYHTGGLYGP